MGSTLNDLKAWITAAIADVTKNILQRIWQKVNYRWDVNRARDGAHSEALCI